jgi:uncharacterized tellurite resistance protein B-like protein
MIIWGWKARYSTLSTGSFYCPHEDGDRGYRHRQARRWFTLFFIPLIPLAVLGDFIECTSCGRQYDPVVLSLPTAGEMMDNLANAMRYAIVAIVTADEAVSDDERRAALEIMERFSDTPYTAEDLERDLIELSPDSLEDAFGQVAGSLNDLGKESLIVACMAVSAADGHVDEREVKQVIRAGRALGLSPAHLRAVMAGTPDPVDGEPD